MYFVILLFSAIFVLSLKKRDLGLMLTAVLLPTINSFTISKYFGLCFIFNVLFLILYHREIKKYFSNKNPYRNIYRLYICLILLSTCIAPIKHFFMAIQEILSFSIIPICIAICFQKNENLRKFPIIVFICAICLIAYTGLELIFNNNPVVQAAINQGVFSGTLMTGTRFNIKQIQSLFAYHETAGCFFWMIAVFFMWILLLDKRIKLKTAHIIIIIIMTSSCCFFTGSRSSILALCIGLLPFAISNKKYIMLLPIVIILCLYFSPKYFMEIYNSIVESDNVSIGSSQSLRISQLEISIDYMLSSPHSALLGNGNGFTNDFLIENITELAGAESLWFRLMIDQGLLGVAFMTYVFIYSWILCFRIHKYLPLMVLSFLVAKSVAVVPCINVSWLFIFILYFKYNKAKSCHQKRFYTQARDNSFLI